MAWQTYPDSTFDTGKPGKGSIIENIYKNTTAQANGDSGAPKNQTASYAALSVDTAALKDSNVTKAKNAANSVGGSELIATFQTWSSQAIDGAETWVPSAGFYMVATDTSSVDIEIYANSAWQGGAGAAATGFIMSDGTNVRYKALGSPVTIYYLEISD